MANYFVLDSKFTPYTFEELIKPYQLYNEAYKEQEAALDAAAENEFASANIGEGDTLARSLYDAATGKLSSLSEELATKGLTAGIRAKVKSTARDYKNTMNNLKTAQDALNAERQRRAKLGDGYVFQQSTLGLDDFLNGQVPNQTGVDLEKLRKDIATSFTNRAKSISKDTWDKLFDAAGKQVEGYYDVSSTGGLTVSELDSILNGKAFNTIMSSDKVSDSEKLKLAGFRNEIDNKLASIGYDNFDSDNARRSIIQAINEGATFAIGETKHSYQKDLSYIDPGERQRLHLQKRAQDRADKQWDADPNNPEGFWWKGVDKTNPQAVQERRDLIKGKSSGSGSQKPTDYKHSKYTIINEEGISKHIDKTKEGEEPKGVTITLENINKIPDSYMKRSEWDFFFGRDPENVAKEYKEKFNSQFKEVARLLGRPETDVNSNREEIFRTAKEKGIIIKYDFDTGNIILVQGTPYNIANNGSVVPQSTGSYDNSGSSDTTFDPDGLPDM